MKAGRNILIQVLLTAAIVAAVSACRPAGKAATERAARISAENFDRFYDRFHSDSLFQLSRIRFPLGGYRADGVEHAKWSQKDWPLMRTRIYDVDTTEFKISYRKSDTEFIQKVWLEDSGFSSEARFRLINNRWYLVYILDLNL